MNINDFHNEKMKLLKSNYEALEKAKKTRERRISTFGDFSKLDSTPVGSFNRMSMNSGNSTLYHHNMLGAGRTPASHRALGFELLKRGKQIEKLEENKSLLNTDKPKPSEEEDILKQQYDLIFSSLYNEFQQNGLQDFKSEDLRKLFISLRKNGFNLDETTLKNYYDILDDILYKYEYSDYGAEKPTIVIIKKIQKLIEGFIEGTNLADKEKKLLIKTVSQDASRDDFDEIKQQFMEKFDPKYEHLLKVLYNEFDVRATARDMGIDTFKKILDGVLKIEQTTNNTERGAEVSKFINSVKNLYKNKGLEDGLDVPNRLLEYLKVTPIGINSIKINAIDKLPEKVEKKYYKLLEEAPYLMDKDLDEMNRRIISEMMYKYKEQTDADYDDFKLPKFRKKNLYNKLNKNTYKFNLKKINEKIDKIDEYFDNTDKLKEMIDDDNFDRYSEESKKEGKLAETKEPEESKEEVELLESKEPEEEPEEKPKKAKRKKKSKKSKKK